jgi:hypothetical protein
MSSVASAAGCRRPATRFGSANENQIAATGWSCLLGDRPAGSRAGSRAPVAENRKPLAEPSPVAGNWPPATDIALWAAVQPRR